MTRKICISGVHGVGKSRICREVQLKILTHNDKIIQKAVDGNSKECDIFEIKYISEQFREVVKDLITSNSTGINQTEEITLATYAKQLYLENLYTAQGKNILCDRSVLDSFAYYDYFNKIYEVTKVIDFEYIHRMFFYAKKYTKETYSKIYLIEPSDREIENDGFRLTDKKQQLEIHELFLEYFEDFPNVEIINQEEANKPEFFEKVVGEFGL